MNSEQAAYAAVLGTVATVMVKGLFGHLRTRSNLKTKESELRHKERNLQMLIEWDREDRRKQTQRVLTKIDENTQRLSTEGSTTSNTSLHEVTSELQTLRTELAEMRKMHERLLKQTVAA